MDPSVGNFNVSMEERGLFACVGGGLAGYGVGVGVSLLLDELESLEDGCLVASFGGMDSRPTLVFLFIGREERIISCLSQSFASSRYRYLLLHFLLPWDY